MPSVTLRFPPKWWAKLKTAADQSGQTVKDFLLEVIEVSYPRPDALKKLPEDDFMATANHLCARLESTKIELLAALSKLTSQTATRGNPKALDAKLAKRRKGARLRARLKELNLKQIDLARHIGVSVSAISQLITGLKPVPPAWTPALVELLGEDWMKD